jgi:tellurite resistance protein
VVKGLFAIDRTHSVIGPYAAYLPVVGVLISPHYVRYLPADLTEPALL